MFQFWNQNTRNLAQLFDQTDPDSDDYWKGKTLVIFETEIQKQIRKLDLPLFIENNKLLKETLAELTSLLELQKDNWKNLKVNDINKFLPGLLKATQWKLEILNYNYSVEKTTELTKRGLKVLPAVGEVLEAFRHSDPNLKISKLVQNNLQYPADYQEVTMRSLRCIIALLRNPVHFNQTIFVWNSQFELGLKPRLLESSLYEQLELFVFMAKNDNDALPIRELRSKLQKFVQKRMDQMEKAKQASDMVHDALLHFFEKRKDYMIQNFYVDKKLESYILDLAKNRKELRKKRYKQDIIQNENTLDEHHQQTTENEDLSEIIEILKSCIRALDHKCKKMIYTRYLGDYAEVLSYEAVAAFLSETPKTVEKRGRSCNKKLKDCVTLKSNQRGLRPY